MVMSQKKTLNSQIDSIALYDAMPNLSSLLEAVEVINNTFLQLELNETERLGVRFVLRHLSDMALEIAQADTGEETKYSPKKYDEDAEF